MVAALRAESALHLAGELNLGREAVRELVQSSADPTEAQRALGAILPGGSERERMLGDYDELHAPSWAGRCQRPLRPRHWSPNSAERPNGDRKA